MYDNIPQELKDKHQWVNWKKDGKKIPLNPKTLKNAQSNNPQTWGTYEDAVARVNNKSADGIGFMFNNDYIAVDLDDCFDENHKPKNWAREILSSLYPSYTEYSVSGKGVHIFLKHTDSLPGKGLNVNFKLHGLYDGVGGVEIYENGRYFIMTGNIIDKKATVIMDKYSSLIPFYIKYQNIIDRSADKKKAAQVPQNIFDDIRYMVKMESVLSHYGYKVGRSNKICCPFHKEDTPSFHIYEYDYFCYGCREYGDTITFVSKMENISNLEAANKLIETFGLNIETYQPTRKTKLSKPELRVDTTKALPTEIEMLLNKGLNLAEVKEYDSNNAEIVKSEIPTLDNALGGFEMGQLTLWTGINAAGKSTVLGQCMIESIEQGYNVFAFSGELQAHKFQYWIDLQAAGRPHLSKEISSNTGREYYRINPTAKAHIHNWYNNRMWLYDNMCGMEYGELLKVMDAFAVYKKCKVFLIDNLMRLDLKSISHDQYEAQSEFVNSLSDFAQNRNVHIHLVAHPRKIMGSIITKQDVSGAGDLTNRADNVLAVHRATPAFREEIYSSKQYVSIRNDIKDSKVTNAIEIFKSRDAGIQDLMIMLTYCEGSKRLEDRKFPGLSDKEYSWVPDSLEVCPFREEENSF